MNKEETIREMMDQVDILDAESHTRHNVNDLCDSYDMDPEDEYYNEAMASGLHPSYADFDDPDEIDSDFIV